MNLRTPLSVGLVVLAACGGTTWFFMRTSKDNFDERNTYALYADFADASGIRSKTRVQIGGIDVGRIATIGHVRGKDGRLVARVTMRIGNDYEIFDDAEVHKAAESLLGDFRIDLDPGTPGHRKLAAGEGIGQVHSLSDLDEIKSQLVKVTRNVSNITDSFAHVLGGPKGEGSLQEILQHLSRAMGAIDRTTVALEGAIAGNDKVLSQVIQDIGKVTATLAEISKPGGDLLQTSHALASIGQKVDRMADSVQELLGSGDSDEGGLTGSNDGQTLRAALNNLSASLRNISDITRKVDEGQGTLGRIVNDPTIADRVEETLTSANQIIGSIAGLETQIELRSQYDVPFSGTNQQIQPSIKNTVALRIWPKPDKYYLFEAVSDPRGKQTRQLTTTQINGNAFNSEETVISYNSLKFSAAFAKRYYFATLRFGIIENTGGLGVNLHFLSDRGQVRLDAFDFARRDPNNLRTIFPRLRATAMYEVVKHISVQGGFDDPFNADLRTWFLGGVLRFTDEDLKALLTVAPRP